jgi:hypothetical protein
MSPVIDINFFLFPKREAVFFIQPQDTEKLAFSNIFCGCPAVFGSSPKVRH